MEQQPDTTARNDQVCAESRTIALQVAAFYDALPTHLTAEFREQLAIEFLCCLLSDGEDVE